jgi:hypothetical protein
MVGKSEQIRNGDAFYPFRQDSDMLALTCANSPDIRLLGHKEKGKMTWMIFSDEYSDIEKLWGTARFSPSELHEISGVDIIHPLSSW